MENRDIVSGREQFVSCHQPRLSGEQLLHHALFDEPSFVPLLFKRRDLVVHVIQYVGDSVLLVKRRQCQFEGFEHLVRYLIDRSSKVLIDLSLDSKGTKQVSNKPRILCAIYRHERAEGLASDLRTKANAFANQRATTVSYAYQNVAIPSDDVFGNVYIYIDVIFKRESVVLDIR